MKKRCEICGTEFEPTRSWSKCCSDECRKKDSSLRVEKYRKKHYPEVKTLQEMKTKEPYKKNYEKIMGALKDSSMAIFEDKFLKDVVQKEKYLERHKKQRKKITVSSLSRETGLSRDTLNKYLLALVKWGVIERKNNLPTKKHMLDPIKLHYDSLIENTDIEYIYPGLDYMLFLPENLNAKEFSENGLTVLFEEAFDKFFYSVWVILLHAKLEKAKELWMKKINSNMDIYPPLKLHLWIEVLISQITNRSPVLRNANIYDRKSDPDIEKEIQNCLRSLPQLIFKDICQWLRYYQKDIKKMNDRMQSSFNDNVEYINNVRNEIHEIIEEKEFGIAISPSAFLKPSLSFSEGFDWLLKEKVEQKLIKVQRVGKKRVIRKTTVRDSIKNSLSFSPLPSKVEEIEVELGENWFNKFSKDTQNELRNLSNILGYTENTFYQILGLFVFPLPILVMPAKKSC